MRPLRSRTGRSGLKNFRKHAYFLEGASIIVQSANCVREVFDDSGGLHSTHRTILPQGVIVLDERGLVMFRKVMIALLATAALGLLAPDVVSARGGGGGGFGGGMHGGFGGGFHGGWGHGGFRGGGGFGRGGFHAARFNGGRFRGAAIGGRGFRAGFRDGFRAGQIAGNSRLAIRTTTRNAQRTRVQCLTSDCSSWHSWTE
jgi:hypothetical protein